MADDRDHEEEVLDRFGSPKREAIADKGPSVQFFRMFAPVPGASGVLEVKVSKLGNAATAKPDLLFTRSVSYKL